jgi:hypothetical protein
MLMPRKKSRMTNGDANAACHDVAERILQQDHNSSYSAKHQGATYSVSFSEGTYAIHPEPCPKVKLKLLNKVWHQVRPPELNN